MSMAAPVKKCIEVIIDPENPNTINWNNITCGNADGNADRNAAKRAAADRNAAAKRAAAERPADRNAAAALTNNNINYINRLINDNAKIWNKIKALNLKSNNDIIKILEEFATIQDKLYGDSYNNKNKTTLLDDFLEIAYITKFYNENLNKTDSSITVDKLAYCKTECEDVFFVVNNKSKFLASINANANANANASKNITSFVNNTVLDVVNEFLDSIPTKLEIENRIKTMKNLTEKVIEAGKKGEQNIIKTVMNAAFDVIKDKYVDIAREKIESAFGGKEYMKKLLSDVHDAWSYSRFVRFNKELTGIENFVDLPGDDTDLKRHVKFNLDDNVFTTVQNRRLNQFIEFNILFQNDEEDAMKDIVPIITFIKMLFNDRKELQQMTIKKFREIKSMIFESPQGGRRKTVKGKSTPKSKPAKTKTSKRVMIGGKNRVVYSGKRGGEYVKKGGEFIPVSKAMSAAMSAAK
jgi:hypothetical protein